MMLKSGSWYLKSKTDSRWNCHGESSAVGGFVIPPECVDKIDELKKELGEESPADLEWGYFKD